MKISPYIDIARPNHWFKNVFMVPGMLLYFFFHPESRQQVPWLNLAAGFLAVCLVTSSNYIINEILDAPHDRHHPTKKNRPIPSGLVNIRAAYALWILAGLSGLFIGFTLGRGMGLSLIALWAAGLLYNVPPVRTKDKPYLDVLSESANNPIRLLLGWYSAGSGLAPPYSVLLAYWMFGGFLMALKRFAEYRTIGDRDVARAYRRSFAFYTEERLLVSVFFYVALFALFSGYFIARYKMELILSSPLLAFTMAYYFHLGFKPNSAVQYPETLYRESGLMISVILTFLLCTLLLYLRLPFFTSLFAPAIPPPAPPLLLMQ